MELQVKNQVLAKIPVIPEFKLYPYTDTNKDTIQELEDEGGNENE